jgi:hypothetical protein
MRRLAWIVVGLLTLAEAASVGPQRGFQRRTFSLGPQPWVYDGDFVFCRLWFRQAFDGDGNGWSVDYPRADLNFPFRLGELTSTRISHDERGDANHVIVTATDPHLFQCPFVMMTEPGGADFTDEEALSLRQYLQKGGFLWVDDFWGEYAWAVWERAIRKVLPASQYAIFDVPLSHPIFNMKYVIHKIPQIPSINFWFGSGFQTSERYADSAVPHVRAIQNAQGHIMVLMTHNTDFGDAFEREGDDRRYFDTFASSGYAFGINVFMYAMTH